MSNKIYSKLNISVLTSVPVPDRILAVSPDRLFIIPPPPGYLK
jgi:hypothetical protein